ncbi:hypothetical protein HD593_010967 [Nonomuraea rubra]|uniref:Uncharacterized protein n=1 Tax=Nonomuraea rubra TaxID=46180 RepID=A0A7X0U5M1_9ACTN|nr:hypothetical protein [Nonomuraea rubra]
MATLRARVAEEIVLELRAEGHHAREESKSHTLSESDRQRRAIEGDVLLWAATRVEERYAR